MATECLTSVGRMVWGHPGKPQKKTDQKTKQAILKDGQPIMQWAFGIAFPKADFGQYVWPFMDREIKTGFPNGVPQGFSYKYKDGDTVDRQGKPFSLRPGWAGCFVLNYSSEAFAPPVYKLENGVYRQLNPEEYKTGDYFAVKTNFVLNIATNPQHSSSIYVNPVGIIHVGYGEEIKAMADPNAMFGGANFALPPGASATPMMPANAPGMPNAPQPGGMPGQPGGMPGQPGGMPGQPGGMPGQPGGMPGQPGGMPGQPPQQPVYAPQPQPQYGQPGGMPGYQPPAGGPISTGPGGGMPPTAAPPPAHDFVNNAGGMPGQPQYGQPGMPGQPQYGQPGGMPGQMPPGGMPGGPR